MAELTVKAPAEAAVLSDQPQSRSALTFVLGLAVSGVLTAVATITLLMGDGLAGVSGLESANDGACDAHAEER